MDIRFKILSVLAGQSPGYYAHPNSSAFISEDLEPGEVEAELFAMLDEGLVEREQYVQIIRTGREIYLEQLEKAKADVDNAPDEKSKKKAQKALYNLTFGPNTEPEHETENMLGGFMITDKGRELLAAGEPDSRPKKIKQPKKRI